MLGKGANAFAAEDARDLAEANAEGQSDCAAADRPWWDFGLADEVLNEVGLYYLGQGAYESLVVVSLQHSFCSSSLRRDFLPAAWYQATDIGEMLETFR